MARKRFTSEQIITMLREAEVLVNQGSNPVGSASPPTSDELCRDPAPDLVPDAPEGRLSLQLGAGDRGRVDEAMMDELFPAGEDRAGLAGVVADRDHGVEILVQQFVDVFGSVVRDVDPDLQQDGGGPGIDLGRLGARTEGLVPISQE